MRKKCQKGNQEAHLQILMPGINTAGQQRHGAIQELGILIFPPFHYLYNYLCLKEVSVVSLKLLCQITQNSGV